MSVTESWLRDGTPAASLNALATTLHTQYYQWEFVFAFPRAWSVNTRKNLLYAPVCLLVFGRSTHGDAETSPLPHVSDTCTCSGAQGRREAPLECVHQSWRLLYHQWGLDCLHLEETAVTALRELLQAVPAGLRPMREPTASCVLWGNTHERIGLVPKPLAPVVLRILERSGPWCLQGDQRKSSNDHDRVCVTILPAQELSGRSPDKDGASAVAGAPGIVANVLLWLRTRVPAGGPANTPPVKRDDDKRSAAPAYPVDVDTEYPPLPDGRLLRLLEEVNPLLFTSRFEPYDAERKVLGPAPQTQHEPPAAAETETSGSLASSPGGTAMFATSKQAHVGCFTIPVECYASCVADASTAEKVPQLFRHVLLVQRQSVVKRDPDVDFTSVGPRDPQPIACELHLFKDPGDVRHTAAQLLDEGAVDVNYEDLIHEDGEVQFQFVPLEGTPFSDIDALLQVLPPPGEDTAGRDYPRATVTHSSCGWCFPRAALCVPTGAVGKETILSGSHAIVKYLPLAVPAAGGDGPSVELDLVEQVAIAVRYISDRVRPIAAPVPGPLSDATSVPTYTLLPSDFMPLEIQPGGFHCAWCYRHRQQLLRCSACKSAHYCSKAHQSRHWKDAHKAECAVFKAAAAAYAAEVAPVVQTESGGLPATPWRSCAETLLVFLRLSQQSWNRPTEGAQTGARRPLVLHMFGMDVGQEEFIEELGRLATSLRDLLGRHTSGSDPFQLRIVLCSEHLAAAHQHRVSCIHENEEVVVAPETGVLGDTWHLHQRTNAAGATGAAVVRPVTEALVLVRMLCRSYHHYATSDAAEREPPDLLMFYGSCGGTDLRDTVARGRDSAIVKAKPVHVGLTYLSAATAIIADHWLGRKPIFLTEPSLVAATRTWTAVTARLANSSAAPTPIRDRFLGKGGAGGPRGPPGGFTLNVTACCSQPMSSSPATARRTDEGKPPSESAPLPLHANLYYIYIPAEP